MPTFCREAIWQIHFETRLDHMIGWGRTGAQARDDGQTPALHSRAAYRVAEHEIRALLPACHGCLCVAITA